jgi:hypothetical protein
MSKIKVGDFVKHKATKNIIFQVVQILEPVKKSDCRMLNCIRVTGVYSYLETDLHKYELTNKDSEKIVDHCI